MQKTRDIRIDFLRSVAIILVVLAHSDVTGAIFSLRAFDVPLMIFLMAMSYKISNRKIPYPLYLNKRFRRLIVPTWKFLVLFFIITLSLSWLYKIRYPYDIDTVISSFTLMSGIGYVYIFRIFFIVALLSPLALKISNKLISKKYLVFYYSLSIIFLQLLFFAGQDLPNAPQILFYEFLVTSYGYFIITIMGMAAKDASIKTNFLFGTFNLILFIFSFLIMGISNINIYKYPPQIPYITFGLAASHILFAITSYNKVIFFLNKFSFIGWLSRNSITLYYIHIFVIFILDNFFTNLSLINNWLINFVVILTSSLFITATYSSIKNRIQNKNYALAKKED